MPTQTVISVSYSSGAKLGGGTDAIGGGGGREKVIQIIWQIQQSLRGELELGVGNSMAPHLLDETLFILKMNLFSYPIQTHFNVLCSHNTNQTHLINETKCPSMRPYCLQITVATLVSGGLMLSAQISPHPGASSPLL